MLDTFGGRETGSLRTYWVAAIAEYAHHIFDPKLYPKICRDPHDDKFLYCAASAKADYLVTGDKDLKILEGSYDFRIITPSAFLEILKT